MRLTVFLKRHFLFLKERAVLWNMLRIAWFILDTSSFSEVVLVPLSTCFAWYLWWYRVFPVSVYVSPIEVLLFRTLFRWVIGSRSMWLNWQSHFLDESDYWWVISWYYVPFLLRFSGWLSWSVPAELVIMSFDSMNNKGRFFPLKKKNNYQWTDKVGEVC